MLDKEKIQHIFDQLRTVQNSLISRDQKKTWFVYLFFFWLCSLKCSEQHILCFRPLLFLSWLAAALTFSLHSYSHSSTLFWKHLKWQFVPMSDWQIFLWPSYAVCQSTLFRRELLFLEVTGLYVCFLLKIIKIKWQRPFDAQSIENSAAMPLTLNHQPCFTIFFLLNKILP